MSKIKNLNSPSSKFPGAFPGTLLGQLLAAFSASAVVISFAPRANSAAANDAKPVQPEVEVIARPKIAGELVPDATLKTVGGEAVSLESVIQNKFTVLVFSKPENIWFEAALGYFRRIVPYLTKLDYQVVVITPYAYDYIHDIDKVLKHGRLLVDEDRVAFRTMGLMDKTDPNAKPIKTPEHVKPGAAVFPEPPSNNAVFLIGPNRKIMFQFASISDSIPFSGEVLVLAARVYKDAMRTPAAQAEVK